MKCPRDGQLLEEGRHDGVLYQCCPKCSGLWLSLESNAKLAAKLKNLPSTPAMESSKHRHQPPVGCPLHEGEVMDQRYIHGIQLDLCVEGNGVWLDQGEQRYLIAWKAKLDNAPGLARKSASTALEVGSFFEVVSGVITAIACGL